MFVIYYYQYHSRIYSHFVYRTGDSALAEDLTSETFLKAYQAFDRYNRDYAFSTWIYTIARNTLHDHWRKHKSDLLSQYYDEHEEEIEDEQSEEVWFQTEQSLDRKTIMSAVEQLTPMQQSCMVMKYLDALSNKEISQILELSEPAVRQHLTRGGRAIQSLLAPYYQQ